MVERDEESSAPCRREAPQAKIPRVIGDIGARLVYAAGFFVAGTYVTDSLATFLILPPVDDQTLQTYGAAVSLASERPVIALSLCPLVVYFAAPCMAFAFLFIPSRARRRMRAAFLASVFTLLLASWWVWSLIQLFGYTFDAVTAHKSYPSFQSIWIQLSPLERVLYFPLLYPIEHGQGTIELILAYSFTIASVVLLVASLIWRQVRWQLKGASSNRDSACHDDNAMTARDTRIANICAVAIFLASLACVHARSLADFEPVSHVLPADTPLVTEWQHLNAGYIPWIVGGSEFLGFLLPWVVLGIPGVHIRKLKWYLYWICFSQVSCAAMILYWRSILQYRYLVNPADTSSTLNGLSLLGKLFIGPLLTMSEAGLGALALIIYSALLGLFATAASHSLPKLGKNAHDRFSTPSPSR